MVEGKVLMALAEENDDVSKAGARIADDTKVIIPGVERPWLSEAEGFILPNHDTENGFAETSDENTRSREKHKRDAKALFSYNKDVEEVVLDVMAEVEMLSFSALIATNMDTLKGFVGLNPRGK
nr:hypothetical protein [Tanacetum cinerariifolium]